MQTTGNERGYLHERFRLFHTVDQNELKVDWHFHTFNCQGIRNTRWRAKAPC